MSRRTLPNLISVTSINPDGSHLTLHPSDVHGPYTLARRVVAALLMVVYVALPWIPINGFPAVFMDVENRRFHLMGFTLVTQDLWLGFFLVTGLAFFLFYVTAFVGRVWCGWSCPYTIFLEHIFRRIERIIDGDAQARRKLESDPWGPKKIFKRVLKHSLFILFSLAIAHVFLSYFVSIPKLYSWMHHSPGEHVMAFGIVAFIAICLYFAFSWFREQFCIILCPYGRLQSALSDDDTVVIGYDQKRGEPRGKVGAEGAGHCIDCHRCVQVCPTGIDIRNGLQLECIGCAACVDACDDIMTKLKRPKGLVRYGSFNSLRGKPLRFIRPRTIGYTVFAVLGAVVFLFCASTLRPFRVLAKRIQGQPYFVADGQVRDQFNLHIINKRHEAIRCHITLDAKTAPEGMKLLGAEEAVEVPPLGELDRSVIITMPVGVYRGSQTIRLLTTEEPHGGQAKQDVEFLGPDLRFSKLPTP